MEPEILIGFTGVASVTKVLEVAKPTRATAVLNRNDVIHLKVIHFGLIVCVA